MEHKNNPVTGGVVKIKLPETFLLTRFGLAAILSSKNAYISSNGKVLWKGRHGQTASFTIYEPAKIVIDLGRWGNLVKGTVEPAKQYELVKDEWFHIKATFMLSETGGIDSDL